MESKEKEEPERVYIPKARFPQRLISHKKTMAQKQFEEIKDIFKSLTINVPFLSAIKNMPTYANFSKICVLRKEHK